MPSGKNWSIFIFINICFILQLLYLYVNNKLIDIRKNWNIYKCNPLYMPLSKDIKTDFKTCVQTAQTNYIGYLIQPLSNILNNLTTLNYEIVGDIQMVREMINKTRTFISYIVTSIFGVFLNIVIEFQKTTIQFKDLVSKIVATLNVFMYIIDGTNKTINSSLNGPLGQALTEGPTGLCFYENTNIKLNNGEIKKIKDIKLNDVIENGSIVIGLLTLSNIKNENYYKFKNMGVNNEDIYVTGTHMVLGPNNKYIYVKDHPDAILDNTLKTDSFNCLITNNHTINIGNMIFWDWEDDNIKL